MNKLKRILWVRTAKIRYLENHFKMIDADYVLPPQIILQQLWVNWLTWKQDWRNVPMQIKGD